MQGGGDGFRLAFKAYSMPKERAVVVNQNAAILVQQRKREEKGEKKGVTLSGSTNTRAAV